MKPHPIRLVSAFALSLCAVAGASAADNLDPSQGRMLVAPFYEALNAAPGKDVGAMIGQATGADADLIYVPTFDCATPGGCSPAPSSAFQVIGLGQGKSAG